MTVTVRPIERDELLAWYRNLGSTFFMFPSSPEASVEFRKDRLNYARTLGAFEGANLVGTYRTFPADLTLPGLRAVPVSAVSAVTVRPTHRRRGILTQLIDLDVQQGIERGDVAGILYSAEWPIYGRFGYGPATWQARWEIRARAARFLVPPTGSIEICHAADVRDVIPELFARYAAGQPGEITRAEYVWDIPLGLIDPPGRPRWSGQVALHRDDAGTPDGYLRYTGEGADTSLADAVATVEELVGVTPEAEIALWQFICGSDLVGTVKASGRRVSEPLTWHLADGRAAQINRVDDGLWFRPYDVARLLGERGYDREANLVIEVDDVLNGRAGPAAGRYRLEASPDGATCRRTTDAPDVTIAARILGSAALGGNRLLDAAQVGGAVEHRPGALREADLLLRTAAEPWCYTFF